MRTALKWLRRALLVGVVLAALAGAAALWIIHDLSRDLPEIFAYEDYRRHTAQTSRVLAADGTVLREYFEERRTVVERARLPDVLKLAVVAAEDADFFSHRGVDPIGILRAAWKNVRAQRFAQGASTITQQVARTFYLSQEKTFRRKIREAILAVELERRLSKDELLALYLNQIYFGHGRYGAEEASRYYFGRSVTDIGLAEAALLAGVLNSPERLSPYKHPERCRERRQYVLEQMMAKGMVDRARGEAAQAASLGVLPARPRPPRGAPYFVDAVRRRVEAVFGADALRRGGLIIHTTVDPSLQSAAEAAVSRGLARVDLGIHAWRAPRGHDTAAAAAEAVARWGRAHGDRARTGRIVLVAPTGDAAGDRLVVRAPDGDGVLDLRRAAPRLEAARELAGELAAGKRGKRRVEAPPDAVGYAPGDVLWAAYTGTEDDEGRRIFQLEGGPQAALVALDPASRDVVALVGGDDARHRPFNRAIQARRQAGSAFKPIVYAAALADGAIRETDIFHDTPETYRLPDGRSWTPRNFSGRYDGRPLSLADALAGSVNVVAVQVIARAGVDAVIALAERLGIAGELARNYTLALGSAEVTPLELTNAIATLSNDGHFLRPRLIRRVTDSGGAPLPYRERWLDEICEQGPRGVECAPEGEVIPAETARLVLRAMREVVRRGTARALRKLGRPAAGKTGTTNEGRNLWFVGATPDLVAGVFIGHDDRRPIRRGTGGRYAAPLWLDFMQAAHAGRPVREVGAWAEPPLPTAADLAADAPADGGPGRPAGLPAPPPDLPR